MSGSHPYRKQAVNIPEHLLPQIYMNQQLSNSSTNSNMNENHIQHQHQTPTPTPTQTQNYGHGQNQNPNPNPNQNLNYGLGQNNSNYGHGQKNNVLPTLDPSHRFNEHSMGNGNGNGNQSGPGLSQGSSIPTSNSFSGRNGQFQSRSKIPPLSSPVLSHYQDYPKQQQQQHQPQQQQPHHQQPVQYQPQPPVQHQPQAPVQQQSQQQQYQNQSSYPRSYPNSRNASNSSINRSQDSFRYNQNNQSPQLSQPSSSQHSSNISSHPSSQSSYQSVNNVSNQLGSMQINHNQYQPLSQPVNQMNLNQPVNQMNQLMNPNQSMNHNRRKPPPVQTDRRIVSTPSISPITPKYDSHRTKSLSSMKMASIQQGQPMDNGYGNDSVGTGNGMNSMSSMNGSHRGSASSISSNNIHHTFSLSSKSRSFTSLSKLSSSLSTKKFNSSTSLQGKNGGYNHNLDRNVSSSTIASQRTLIQISKKPKVYPAMLSRVANVFRDLMFLTINTKDGLEYHDTFTGKMAVDIICRIIRTNDRNLSLLLGRALDSQKLFHDVTYNHRLRDSVHEVYEFNHIYRDVELFDENGERSNSSGDLLQQQLAMNDINHINYLNNVAGPNNGPTGGAGNNNGSGATGTESLSGVNGVFTILTDCYSPTCSRNSLCYSIACPRRLEQQARLNLKPQGGLKRAVSRLSIHEDENISLWHETVPQKILDKLDKHEKMKQELIYEFIYTERDYVKDLEFMTDFYILPLRNPTNNIIPEREREAFIRTVFGGVNELLRLAKSMSEQLTKRQQQQKPVIEMIADIFLNYVDKFEPFIKYSGNKVFASFEHERQQQVNMRYASFLDAIEKRPESRKQDLSSFLIKGIQRPARYQLLLNGILKNSKEDSPDYKNLVKAKEEIEKILVKINIQTGESTDRHKIMVLHRLLGKQTLEEKFNFKLSFNNRIIYQVTLNRKKENEKIDLYLFEHALLLVKHKIQNKREQYKVFEKPIYLPLLFVNSGYEIPTFRNILNSKINGSIISELKTKVSNDLNLYNGNNNNNGSGIGGGNAYNNTGYTTSSSSNNKFQLQINFLGLGSQQVHVTLNADDIANQNQILSQISNQQKKLIEKHDIFSLTKYETRRFTGNNKINCAVPCYGGKKLLYGTDLGVWVSTVRTISITNNEKITSDPTMVISKMYITQIEVLVEYSKLLILSDKSLYEFDLSCTDSLDHIKNTRSGKLILTHVSSFKTGICDGKLLVCAIKSGNVHQIDIFEPSNPFDNKNKKNHNNKKYDIREISFTSEPISISFLRTRLCIGCMKGFEILSLEEGKKEPILDEADPSLDFAIQKESVNPLSIHRLGKDFLLSYSQFSFLINRNGWRTKHDWGIFWEGKPNNIALFYPYLLSFESSFIEIRDLDSTNLIRALVGENIRFLHSNEHEAMYACEENGYDVIVLIDFLNLKPKSPS